MLTCICHWLINYFLSIADRYWCSTVCLTIYLLKDIWVVSIFWLLQNKLLWTTVYMLFESIKFSFLCYKCPVVYVKFLFLLFDKLPYCFPEWMYHFTIPQQSMIYPVSPYPCQHLVLLSFFILATLIVSNTSSFFLLN